MANKRRFSYRDPNEDEYIFNCLVNYPRWAKERLSPQELSIFKSQNSIRQFVNNATGDQKRLLMAKANIKFICLYIDFNKESPLDLSKFKHIYKSMAVAKMRQKIIEDLQENNSFAISSREILNACYLIAQNCHTPYYFVNNNFKRVFNAVDVVRLKGLKNFKGASEVQEMKDIETFRDICVNFYLSSLDSENYVRVSQKMDLIDARIMLYLFRHRESYIEKTVLHRYMYAYTKKTVSNKIFRLLRDGYIDINRSNMRSPSYTIAELGIIFVNEVVDKVTEAAVMI